MRDSHALARRCLQLRKVLLRLEVICLLLCYKLKYPENFFLLRGNHEAAPINRIYGFYDECKRRYNIRAWKPFNAVFDCLPFSAIVEEKILCGKPLPLYPSNHAEI